MTASAARNVLVLTILTVVLVLIGAPAVWTPPSAARLITLPQNKLGVHLLLDDGRNYWPLGVWPEHLRYARAAIGAWGFVTQVIRSDDLDPARWNTLMRLCSELHLTPILRLATTFDRDRGAWTAPTVDADGSYRTLAARYADFAAALDWPTAEHFLIVGNEPNHGEEWGGRPDPAAYARLLIDVADALHAADADARVLNAALDPFAPNTDGAPFGNGMVYLDENSFIDAMIAADPNVFRSLDGWASHAYPLGPLTRPPWEQTYQVDKVNGSATPSAPEGIVNRGVNGYTWELWKLASIGVGLLPVFITETGWRHAESENPAATDGSAAMPDAQTAAVYLDLALRGNDGHYPQYPQSGWTPWLDDPHVVAVTPFALDGLPTEWGHTNWLKLDASGTIVGAYGLFDAWLTD